MRNHIVCKTVETGSKNWSVYMIKNCILKSCVMMTNFFKG